MQNYTFFSFTLPDATGSDAEHIVLYMESVVFKVTSRRTRYLVIPGTYTRHITGIICLTVALAGCSHWPGWGKKRNN